MLSSGDGGSDSIPDYTGKEYNRGGLSQNLELEVAVRVRLHASGLDV